MRSTKSFAPIRTGSRSIPGTKARTSSRSSIAVRATTSSRRRKGYPSRSRSAPIPDRDRPRILVAALGDSITEGSPGSTGWAHWAVQANPRLEFRNCGIYGQRTDEIAARLDDCVRGADALIVQGGINDIAQGRDAERAAENLRAMVRRGRELDLPVLLADALPWNNGLPGAQPKIRRRHAVL